jgi:hypothetical protein
VLNRKYKSALIFYLSGLFLTVFSPVKMRSYYPSCFAQNGTVKFYDFELHYWLRKGVRNVRQFQETA